MREEHGAYRDLTDFAERLNPKVLGKRALETLSAAGVFDALEKNRAKVYANCDRILSHAGRLADERASGQVSLFGGGDVAVEAATALSLRDEPQWELIETLSHELDAIGFYLSGHPLDDYADGLARLNVMRWSELEARLADQTRSDARIAATVTYKQERRSKSGNKFAFGGFSDPTGQFEAVIFSDTLAYAGDCLEPGKAVLLEIEAEADGENIKTRVKTVQDLDAALGRAKSGLCAARASCVPARPARPMALAVRCRLADAVALQRTPHDVRRRSHLAVARVLLLDPGALACGRRNRRRCDRGKPSAAAAARHHLARPPGARTEALARRDHGVQRDSGIMGRRVP
jgi:DNA polymerase III alpha subunit